MKKLLGFCAVVLSGCHSGGESSSNGKVGRVLTTSQRLSFVVDGASTGQTLNEVRKIWTSRHPDAVVTTNIDFPYSNDKYVYMLKVDYDGGKLIAYFSDPVSGSRAVTLKRNQSFDTMASRSSVLKILENKLGSLQTPMPNAEYNKDTDGIRVAGEILSTSDSIIYKCLDKTRLKLTDNMNDESLSCGLSALISMSPTDVKLPVKELALEVTDYRLGRKLREIDIKASDAKDKIDEDKAANAIVQLNSF